MIVERYADAVDELDPIKYTGRVEAVRGLVLESHGPRTRIGELCRINQSEDVLSDEDIELMAEVVSLKRNGAVLMPFDSMEGLSLGATVTALGRPLQVQVSGRLLGRVIDPLGRPLDNKGPVGSNESYPSMRPPLPALERPPIDRQLPVGVRVIDALLPLGRGQRVGIFSGSGVGKSTLLGMIARNTSADVIVIALIGERGREVREFIEHDLGMEGLARSVVVVSTSDTPAAARVRGGFTATTIAEYFRDLGHDVLLLFDSVTRFAIARREIGLSIGEPPTTRGYPPSVFNLLPQLLERSGNSRRGSITGIYNVLVEGDDLDEPVSDAVRGILDGHFILSRRMAERYHYPAVDVMASVSRLESKIMTPALRERIAALRRVMAAYAEREDLIEIGAYAAGSNALVDRAIGMKEAIDAFLRQSSDESAPLNQTLAMLDRLGRQAAGEVEETNQRRRGRSRRG